MAHRLVLGTMTFAGQVDLEGSSTMIDAFFKCREDNIELDTALMYEDGRTESLLGELFAKTPRPNLTLATKANPWGSNRFNSKDLRRQLEESLARLKMPKVQIFYLHAPDNNTPIEETLKEVNNLHKEGKFDELGLSNYAAWQVVDICHLCERNGWIKPTVYQGMYNVITRSIEAELFVAIRKFGLRFYVFNPLAGGLLTGKYSSFETQPTEGRFVLRKNYQGRYWKKSYFDAVNVLTLAIASVNATLEASAQWSLIELSYSWLVHHSKLNATLGDATIVGVTKLSHLEDALKYCSSSARKLPKPLLDATREAWATCQGDCPRYFQ